MKDFTSKSLANEKTKLTRSFLHLFIFFIVALPTLGQNRIIVNPSFETGSIVPHTGVAYPESQIGDNPQIDGWYSTHPEFNGSEGAIEHWRSGFNGVPSQEGEYFVELNVAQPSRLYQIVYLVNGENIQYDFAHRKRQTETQTVEFSVYSEDGSSKVQTLGSSTSSSQSSWDQVTGNANFTGASGIYQIGFEATAPASGGSGNFLDNVNIGLNGLTEFEHSSITINESQAASFNPHILINGEVQSASSITFTATSTDATEGEDYTFPTKTLNVPVGDYGVADSIPIGFSLIDDSKGRGDRTIVISINSVLGDLQALDANGDGFKETLTVHVIDDDPAPGGVPKAQLWLDASDPDIDADDTNNPADNTDLTTWYDKSGNGNNVTSAGISQGGVNPPSYLNDQFNGKAAVRFDKANSEALGKILSSSYIGDFTVFIVLEGETANPVNFESFFSSWNDPNNGNSFQIDYNSGSANFQVRTTDGNVAFGPFNQELDLFTVRQDGTLLETYSDGVKQNDLTVGTTKGFNAYRIGINRNAGSFYDSKIAEVIVYERALTACEMEQVNDYLGAKYGRDYYDLASNFDNAASYPNDITGIGAFASACSGLKTINEAQSSILTINNPSSNDAQDEFLTVGHNNGSLSNTTENLPIAYSDRFRLEKNWKADRDGDVGTVDLQFNLNGLFVTGTQANDLILLIDNDGDGDYTTGTVSTFTASSYSGGVALFPGVYLPNGATFTVITGPVNLGWTITKTSSASSFDHIGQTLIYNIEIINTGNVPIFDIIVEDPTTTIPPSLLANEDVGNDTVLSPGESWSYIATHLVTQENIDAGLYTNIATATGYSVAGPADTLQSLPVTVPAVQNPQIRLDISADTTTYGEVGEVITFKLVGSNEGNVTLNNVSLDQPFITAAWNPGTFPPGYSDSTFVSYTVTQADLDRGFITYGTTLSGVSPAGISVSFYNEITLTANQRPSFSMLKTTLVPDFRAVGDIQFELAYENTGNVTLGQIALIDSLVSDVPKPLPDMAPGETGTDTVTYTVTQADLDAGTLTNIAWIYGRLGNNGLEVTSSDTVTLGGIPLPEIELVKTASPAIYTKAGQTISYSFWAKNTGNVTLSNVTLDDPLTAVVAQNLGTIVPGDSVNFTTDYQITQADIDAGSKTNIAIVSGTDPASNVVNAADTVTINAIQSPGLEISKLSTTVNYDSPGDEVKFVVSVKNTGNVTLTDVHLIDSLTGVDTIYSNIMPQGAGGQGTNIRYVDCSYNAVQSDVDAGQITNKATVSGLDPNGMTLNDSVSVSVNAAQNPLISLTKTADVATYDAVGDAINYTVTVKNTGNVTVNNATVNDPLTGLSENIVTLAPGDSMVYNETHIITQNDIDTAYVLNTASVSGDASGTVVDASDHVTVTALQAPAIDLQKSVDTTVFFLAGDQATYYFEVTNSGNVTLQAIQLDDPRIPYSANIPDLLPGETWTDSVVYTLTQADVDSQQVVNTATVIANAPDNITTVTSSDNAILTVDGVGALEVVKLAADPKYSALGDSVRFAVAVFNIGNVTLENVVLTDSLTMQTWNIGNMTPFSYLVYYVGVEVTQADLDRGSIRNVASATGNTTLGDPVSGEDEAVSKAVTSSFIEISKTASTATYSNAGEVIDYTLVVTNSGNVTLDNVVVSDTLTGLTRSLGIMLPGDLQTLTTSYTITQADVDGGIVRNTVTVEGIDPQGEHIQSQDMVKISAIQAPSIDVSKTATPVVYDALNEVINYAVTVKNTGNVTLYDVHVVDLLIGLDQTLATLAAGDSVVFTGSYTIEQADLDVGEVANDAVAVGSTSNKINVYDIASFTITADQQPSLKITKTADKSSFSTAGEIINYNLQVRNTGNVTLTDVQVEDPLTSTLINVGELAPLAVQDIPVSYKVTQADLDKGYIENEARASGLNPNLVRVNAKDKLIINGVQNPHMKFTKTAVPTNYKNVGDKIDYTLTFENTGNVTLTDVTVTDPLAGVNQTFASVAPSALKTVNASYFITQADLDSGEVVNTAEAMAVAPDHSTMQTSDSVRVVALQAPSVKLNKIASPKIVEFAGDSVEYTFEVRNTGNVTLTDLNLTDPRIPLDINTPLLTPGGIWTVSLYDTVTQTDIDGLWIPNTANVTATGPNAVVTDKDRALVVVRDVGAIEVEKTAVDTVYSAPGDRLRFNIEVTNIGNITLDSVVVTDSLTNQEWTINTLAPGASQQFVAVYNVTQDDIDRGSVVNTSKATAVEATPTARVVESEDDATVTAARNAAFKLNKTAAANTYSKVGEVIRYKLEVINTGNVTLENITVTDTLTGTSQLIPSLAPGISQTVPVDYSITQADIDRDSVINTATIEGSEVVLTKSASLKSGMQVLAGTLTDDDSYTIYAVQTPEIKVVKTADKSNFNAAGEVVDFTLEVNNAGNVTLHDVVLIDTLTGSVDAIGVMAPGDIQTFHKLYIVTQADMDAGALYNEADVSALTPQNTSINDLDSVRLSANQMPAITLDKTSDVSSFTQAGELINYTITVTNSGNVTLDSVWVSDPLTGTSQLIGSLTPGISQDVNATYITTQADLNTGHVENTAAVVGTDPNGKNVSASDLQLVLALQAPAMNFEKTASPQLVVNAGDIITYTFTTTNTGNTTLTNLQISDTKIPFSKQIASLNPGEVWTETVAYTTTQTDIDGLIIRNVADLSAETPKGLTISENDQALVAIFGKGGIEVVKSTSDPLYTLPGDALHYEMEVTNIGNLTVSNVVVTDSLTSQSWNLGNMAPGADTTLTAIYVVSQADIDSGMVVNRAVLSGTLPSGRTLESSDDAISTAMRAVGLNVTKTASSSTYSTVGETISYTIEVENTGNVTLTDVVVTDTLTGISQNFVSIAPGVTETVAATYVITQEDIDKGSVVNTANALANNPVGPPISGSGTCVILADQKPDVTLTKIADRLDYTTVGEVINFTITAENTGNVSLAKVLISDPLTGFIQTIDTLSVGDSVTVNTSYSITQTDLDAGTLINTATVLGTSPRNFGAGDQASVTLIATQQPSVEIKKVASRNNYDTAGDLINYTLTVTNTGNVSLNTVQISDPLTGTAKLLPVIAPGAQNVTQAAYFVEQSDVDYGSLTNVATVLTSDPSNAQVNDADTVKLNAVRKPFIDVTKTANVANFDAVGDAIDYTVSVKNTGNETLNNIQLEDPLTGLSEFIDTLRVAQTLSFAASYTITQADLDSGQVLNVATAIASDPANNVVTDSDTLTVPALQNPQLSMSMTAAPTMYSAVGDVITYTQTVLNTGNVTLDSVTVTDPLTGQIDLIGTMAPGDSVTLTTTYSILQADLDAGSLVNTANVAGDGPAGSKPSASASVTITGEQTRGISLEKTADNSYYSSYGEAIYYTFTVRNLGNVTLTNVVLKDPLLGFTKTYPTLDASITERVKAFYCVDHPDLSRGYITNIAELSYQDPTLGKVTVKDTATVTLLGKAGVSFRKISRQDHFESVGDTIQYDLEITNTGEVVLSRIKVSDPLTGFNETVPSLEAGASKTMYTEYIIGQQDIERGFVLNSANIIAYDPLDHQKKAADSVITYLSDTLTPIAVCKDITIELDSSGHAIISPEMVDNGSADNNDSINITISKAEFGCMDIGENEVILYVTDRSGNMDSCTAIVAVYDKQTPQLWCAKETTVETAPDACGFVVDTSEFDPKVTDNCDVYIWNSLNGTASLAGELLPLGSHEIIWYAEDSGGNMDSCLFSIKVLDKVAPQLVCPPDTTIGIASDLDSAWINIEVPFVIDNCDAYDLMNDYTGIEDASGMYAVGSTTVTYIVVDTSGNADTCSFVVTVENNPVGVGDLEISDFDINMYPNPTKGLVNIEIESTQVNDVELIVRSINGQEVFRKTYQQTDKFNFDLSDQVSGIYLIQLSTGEQHVIKKLILDRK